MYFIGNSKDFAGDVTLCQFTWSTNECVNSQQCPTNCSRYKGGVPVDPLSAPGKYKIENKYGVHSLIISRLVDWKLFCYQSVNNLEKHDGKCEFPREADVWLT